MRAKATILAAFLLVAVALAGCHEKTDAPGSHFTYTTSDFSFDGPAALPAGWVQLDVMNEGDDFHHIQLFKITDGTTPEAAYEALRNGEHPAYLRAVGGPNSPMPGQTASAWVHLEAGQHILVCEIPDREGTPHVRHGMWKAVMVEGESGAAEPTGHMQVDLNDFSFGGDIPSMAGEHMVKVENKGGQPHEIALFELLDGANTSALLQAFGPNATGPPPARIVGGISGIAAGDVAYVPVTLTAGTYTMLCFLGDPETHAPHFALGMMHEFEVI